MDEKGGCWRANIVGAGGDVVVTLEMADNAIMIN